jgi:hypothetical protein
MHDPLAYLKSQTPETVQMKPAPGRRRAPAVAPPAQVASPETV